MLRNIRLLYIHNFLTDFWPQWPYMVIYLAQVGGSYTAAMSVLAVETLSSAIMDIPTGIFSDRIGRRFTICIGSVCAALGLVCYASAQGLALMYAGAFFMGLSQCLFSGNNSALLYESLKSVGLENKFHHYRGSTGSMYQLALCLSAFSASFLSGYGLRAIFVIAIIPQVLGAIVSLFFKEPRVHIHDKQKSLAILKDACISTYRNPKLLLLVMGRAISYGAGESQFKFQVAFINMLWPVWAVGLYRGVNHAIAFFGFRLSGLILDHIKGSIVLAGRSAYWFISSIVATLLNNAVSPLIFMSGAFLFGPGEVASDHLMQKEFTDQQRATMGSVASFVTSIAFAIIALGIGAVSDHFGVVYGVGLGICVGVLALPIYLWLFRHDF